MFGEELSWFQKLQSDLAMKAAVGGVRTAQSVASGEISASKTDLTKSLATNVGTEVGKEIAKKAGGAAVCVSFPLKCWWDGRSTTTKAITLGMTGIILLGAVLFFAQPYISLAEKIIT